MVPVSAESSAAFLVVAVRGVATNSSASRKVHNLEVESCVMWNLDGLESSADIETLGEWDCQLADLQFVQAGTGIAARSMVLKQMPSFGCLVLVWRSAPCAAAQGMPRARR